MLWTAEAVEDLKKLALEGKSASHISAALGVGSRNAVIGKASRIGIKLDGGGRGSVQREGPARAARPRWATVPLRAAQRRRARLRRGAAARDLQVSPGDGAAGEELCGQPKSERCGGCGWRTFVNPPAGGHWGSEKRRFRLLRAHAGRRAVLLRRPLPNGLSVAAGSAGRSTAKGAPRHRELMAAGVRAHGSVQKIAANCSRAR